VVLEIIFQLADLRIKAKLHEGDHRAAAVTLAAEYDYVDSWCLG
jgi:hypothetical protein